MFVSKKFLASIKLSPIPAYKIAQRAGIDPTTLSKLMNGIVRIKDNDPRVIAVGRVVGLKPDECFQEVVNDVE